MRDFMRDQGEHNERGQVLLIVAGGMVAFLLIAGLVIDAGIGFREKRTAQNVSDLSAMAGTKVVADYYLDGPTVDGADVYAAVDSSTAANGCTVVKDCSWSAEYVKPAGGGGTTEADLGPVANGGAIPSGAQGVRVVTDDSVETFFMQLVGIDNMDVSAAGTALTSQLIDGSPGSVLLPIGVFDSPYQPGTVYELTEGSHGPGNFGWLSWTGSPSADVMAESVCTPNNPAYTFPAWIEGATGVMNKRQARDCLDGYIARGDTVLVPVWSQTNNGGGSHLDYEVVGLAAFVLTDYDQHAVNVNGRFVEFFALPSIPAGYGAPPCNPVTAPVGTCNNVTNFIGLTR